MHQIFLNACVNAKHAINLTTLTDHNKTNSLASGFLVKNLSVWDLIPAGIYFFKVNNEDTRICKIC